jgi:hypothetical protein
MRPLTAYRHLWKGIEHAAGRWDTYIDNTRIGFIGHSYGGGAIPRMAWKACQVKGWGSKSLFLYIMAPWYCHGMTRRHFADFPAHTILVVQAFQDDNINDYRIADDIFNSFTIAENRKCFITVYTATRDDAQIPSGHTMPELNTGASQAGKQVILPIIDSLLCYAFNDSVAQANKNSRRISGLRSACDADGLTCRFYKGRRCAFVKPQSRYVNFWRHAMNPRQTYINGLPAAMGRVLKTPETLFRYSAYGVARLFD